MYAPSRLKTAYRAARKAFQSSPFASSLDVSSKLKLVVRLPQVAICNRRIIAISCSGSKKLSSSLSPADLCLRLLYPIENLVWSKTFVIRPPKTPSPYSNQTGPPDSRARHRHIPCSPYKTVGRCFIWSCNSPHTVSVRFSHGSPDSANR